MDGSIQYCRPACELCALVYTVLLDLDGSCLRIAQHTNRHVHTGELIVAELINDYWKLRIITKRKTFVDLN